MVEQKSPATSHRNRNSRLLISDAAVARVGCRTGSRMVLHDSQLVGFQVVVGSRSRVFRVRLRGHYKTLGHWPVMTAEEARSVALGSLRRRAGMVAALPTQAPTATLESDQATACPAPTTPPQAPPSPTQPPTATLQQVFNDYRNIRKLKATTADDYQAVLNRYVPDWLEQDITAITPTAFEERFATVSAKSKAQANYLSRILSAQWTFAMAKHDITTPNPTQRLKTLGGLHSIKPRDGIISDALQPKWWRTVEALEDKEASAALVFMALTGCRRGEALKLRTTDIDWQARTITFPDTKNGTTHRLPLCRRLHALLLVHCQGRTGAVFDTTSRSVQSATELVSKHIEFKWTLHDLRRTFVTTAQRTLKDLATVKRLVNHSAGGDVTTKHYLRLTVEDLREPLQRVEDAFGNLQRETDATSPADNRE